MTNAYKVRKVEEDDDDDNCEWCVVDENDEMIEGPFDTREEAEEALEDLKSDDLDD
jgi:hypothetical protein